MDRFLRAPGLAHLAGGARSCRRSPPTTCQFLAQTRSHQTALAHLWRSTMSNRIAPKLIAEFIGTFAFVFIGAGTAAIVGQGVVLPGIVAVAPPNALAELRKGHDGQAVGDMERRRLVNNQIRQIEEERLKRIEQAPCDGPHVMERLLARVMGVGIETADMLVHEVLSRNMRDRRSALCRPHWFTRRERKETPRERRDEETGFEIEPRNRRKASPPWRTP